MKASIVSVALACAGCAGTQSSTRPEAFPRSRPVPAPVSIPLPPPAVTDPAILRPSATDSAPSMPVAPPPMAAPASRTVAVLQTALDLLGTKYRYGGQTPDTGFDCSGFVSYVLRQHSIDVPRTVAEQFSAGRSIAQDEIQAGDLVFFTTTGPGATHVGIVVTTGSRWEFIHSPNDGSSVRIERFDSGYWQQRWLGARRVFQAETAPLPGPLTADRSDRPARAAAID